LSNSIINLYMITSYVGDVLCRLTLSKIWSSNDHLCICFNCLSGSLTMVKTSILWHLWFTIMYLFMNLYFFHLKFTWLLISFFYVWSIQSLSCLCNTISILLLVNMILLLDVLYCDGVLFHVYLEKNHSIPTWPHVKQRRKWTQWEPIFSHS